MTTLVNKMTRSKSVESQLSKGLKSFRSPSIKRSQCMSNSSLLNQKTAKQPKLTKKNEMRLGIITLDDLIRLDNTIQMVIIIEKRLHC